jgi:hypothetical protein
MMNKLRWHSPVYSLLFIAVFLSNAAAAESAVAPPSYIADPATYKLLAENDKFRVILQSSKPGHRDPWHSHSTLASYRLTDCTSRIYHANGKFTESSRKAGEVSFLPDTASHSFENTGTTDCQGLLVERK